MKNQNIKRPKKIGSLMAPDWSNDRLIFSKSAEDFLTLTVATALKQTSVLFGACLMITKKFNLEVKYFEKSLSGAINLSVIILICLSLNKAFGQERLGSYRIDREKPTQVYLAPGMGSALLFPCLLTEVFVGRSEDLKAQISPNDKKTLYLNLKLNSSLPTNMIVKCEGQNQVFVFDIFPSKTRHQDLIEFKSIFNHPKSKNSPTPLSPTSIKKIVLSPRTEIKGDEK